MDVNAEVLKRFIEEGRKPNAELKQRVQPLSEKFMRIAEINIGPRVSGEIVYGQAKEEW